MDNFWGILSEQTFYHLMNIIFVIQSWYCLAIGQLQPTAMPHAEAIVTSCRPVHAPQPAQTFRKDSPVQVFQSLKPFGPLDQSVLQRLSAEVN